MGKVISIGRAIDKEIEAIRGMQRRTSEYIEQIERIKLGHLAALQNPQVANAEFIKQLENEIENMDNGIKMAKEAIERSEILISEKLERKARLSGEKPIEIKIR
ncbi:MAG: hypothetical protein PHP25_01775 [Candidatus Moranbacteria bacterium]|nr:hypothetical protein [Candidatus Moranbacteria bacterium]